MRIGSNIRLRADGRYEARYFKNRNQSGRAVYGCVYGTTPEEADAKRIELLSELQRSGAVARIENGNTDLDTGRARHVEPLDEETAKAVERVLNECNDGAALGFLLCLHMGIAYNEVSALQYSDFDFGENTISINKKMSVQSSIKGAIIPCIERRLPIPAAIRRAYNRAERKPDCYLFTDAIIAIESTVSVKYLLRKMLGKGLKYVTPEALQMTFIRRAIESGLSFEAVEAITGMDARIISRRFMQYVKTDNKTLCFISDKYSVAASTGRLKTMNLLILGAGSHGHAIYEIIEQLRIFNEVKFLDDNIAGENIIGRCNEYNKFIDEYPCAFIAIGNSAVRKQYTELLRRAGFILPRIISPDAIVSKNAVIGEGTVIMAQATVNAATVGDYCIIASNALVGFGARVSDFVHIDCGGIVTKDACVPEAEFVGSGEVFKESDSGQDAMGLNE